MPTPTDLVTDLPADFEVFGQAVDSSLADLKGGTTGQVLSKNSNTDMDFVWVTNAAGDITGVTAGTGISGGGTSGTVTITNSMATEITAKGDLIVGTGSATFDNLAIGANGSTIVADSAATTGLRYSATPSASNPIINSAFQIWQRGTSIAGSASVSNYTADRWLGYTAATSTFSRQATGDTTNLPNIQYAMRVQRTAGGTGTDHFYLTYSQESVNSIPYAGKSVTISFYARKGANFNDGTAGLSLVVGTGTGTDQNFLSGYTGSVTALNQPLTLTTTWTRYSYNLNIGATATELGFYFNHRASATAAGAADYYEVTGVQIDVGSVALPFRTYAATIQGELAACQRYYNRFTAPQAYSHLAQGWAISTDNMTAWFYLPVEMRVVPTAIDYASVNMGDGVNAQITPSTITFTADNNNTKAIACTGTKSAGGMTQYRGYQFLAAGTTAAYIGFSAEL